MNLVDYPAVEFNKVVNDDLRDKADEDLSLELRQPENLDRWLDSLLRLKRSTESQLAARKAARAETYRDYARGRFTDDEWNNWVAEYENWRAGVIRVKNSTEDRISEVKRLRRAMFPQAASEEVVRLRNAILAHQDSDLDEEADKRLWSAVDDI